MEHRVSLSTYKIGLGRGKDGRLGVGCFRDSLSPVGAVVGLAAGYSTCFVALFLPHPFVNASSLATVHGQACEQCPALFGMPGELRKHESQEHTRARFVCSMCSAWARSRKAIASHNQRHHRGTAEVRLLWMLSAHARPCQCCPSCVAGA